MDTLARLLRDAMRSKGVSGREAGREAGVAHTTIARILDGKFVSIETLEKVARWLEIDPASVMSTNGGETIAMVSAMVDANPKLKEALEIVTRKFENDEISGDAVQEIVRYIIWRLQE